MARIKTLKDLLATELGVETSERETEGTAGVASARLKRQNPNCIAFIYMNLSVGDTHRIRPNRPATTTAGLIVGPGEWRSFLYREDMILPGREWNVISSAAASPFYLLELVIEKGGEA